MHFSITPRIRTVTSGFFCIFSVSGMRFASRDIPSLAKGVGDAQFVQPALVEVEPVEAPDLVRAGVRAVARADAAVVDLEIEPFRAMHGGVDGANGSHGACLAVHARERLDDDRRVLVRRCRPSRREVAVDANPVHLAVALDFVLADDRDVVLRLTRDDAGGAAGAGGEVDHHAPLELAIEQFGPGEIERERASASRAPVPGNCCGLPYPPWKLLLEVVFGHVPVGRDADGRAVFSLSLPQ